MNFLRSSPFSALSPASLLQDFIFCCWLVLAWLLAADRHSDMNFLRSSPLSALSPASLLHEAIFSCRGVLVLSSAANTHSGAASSPAINHRLSIGFSCTWFRQSANYPSGKAIATRAADGGSADHGRCDRPGDAL